MKSTVLSLTLAAALSSGCMPVTSSEARVQSGERISLPEPRWESGVSVEEALQSRRSVRAFEPHPLALAELSQLLWAAQGVTAFRYRTAPSAGALYPLEVRVVVGDVDGLAAGVYRYVAPEHALARVLDGDVRASLAGAAYWQGWAGKGAVALVFSAVYERTTRKYGDRGIRYAHIEVGHAAQNVYLQAEALELGTVVVGAFADGAVKDLLRMADDEQPLAIMPIGRPR